MNLGLPLQSVHEDERICDGGLFVFSFVLFFFTEERRKGRGEEEGGRRGRTKRRRV